jgi:hypothetical protein
MGMFSMPDAPAKEWLISAVPKMAALRAPLRLGTRFP